MSPRRAREPRFTTAGGAVVLVEESHVIPLVDVAFILRSGSLADPPGKEGLARLSARIVRMGNASLRGHAVDTAIEGMGASLAIDVGHGSIRIHGSVIRRSLPALLDLFGRVLFRADPRPSDLGEVKREAIAEIHSRRDDDRWLAARAFRSHLFGAHPYARSPLGTESSLRRISLDDVRGFLARHLTAPALIVGLAGDVRAREVRPLVERATAPLSRRRAPHVAVPEPVQPPGRRVLLVDKPERTQTQLLIGRLGTHLRDRAFRPLFVANAAFGGMFTARLIRAVRTERGYSYTAQARLGADEATEAWSMYAHPSSSDVAACAALEIELQERLVADGLTRAELALAKGYLTKSHAFDLDTPQKRLEPRLEAELHRLPRSFWADWVPRVRAVTLDDANRAIRARLSPDDLSIVALATAADVRDGLRKLPRVERLEVVPWGRV